MKAKQPKISKKKNAELQKDGGQSKPFFHNTGIQPKLTIGEPDDQYEKEADAMADQVISNESTIQNNLNQAGAVQAKGEEEELQMKTTTQKEEEEQHVQTKLDIQKMEEEEEGAIQAKLDIQRVDEEEDLMQTKQAIQKMGEEEEEMVQPKRDIQRMGEEEEEGTLQAKLDIQSMSEEEEESVQTKLDIQQMEEEEQELVQSKTIQAKSSKGGAMASQNLETRLNQSQGGGQPLPRETNQLMSQAFNTDFSNVNIHTGSDSVQMNTDLQARAFTHGSDIYFNKGEYNTSSTEGKRLLAHELTHVVQQNSAPKSIQRRLFVSGDQEALVQEYLNLVGTAAGLRLRWTFRNPRVRISGNLPAGPTSEHSRSMLRQVIRDRRQHAELHIGTNQPRVAIGAFPGAGSTIQNIDMDDIRNLNTSLAGQGTAKAFHEMMENYNSHAAAAPGFGPSHQVGIESESDVLEDLGIVGRRLGGGIPPTVIPAPPGQPVGPNIFYQTSLQNFTHYFLEMIRRVTAGSPTGPGADFEVISARRIPKVQVSQRTIDSFATGNDAVPAAGAANQAATLADLNANANSTLLIEGFTDSVGSRRSNSELSRERAESVRAFFIANGIVASRIAIVGRGESNFVGPNNTAAGRRQNRRVVMTVHRP